MWPPATTQVLCKNLQSWYQILYDTSWTDILFSQWHIDILHLFWYDIIPEGISIFSFSGRNPIHCLEEFNFVLTSVSNDGFDISWKVILFIPLLENMVDTAVQSMSRVNPLGLSVLRDLKRMCFIWVWTPFPGCSSILPLPTYIPTNRWLPDAGLTLNSNLLSDKCLPCWTSYNNDILMSNGTQID